jgi:peptidoglycan/LPS O-acetylase OafA/YrhL
LTSRNKGARFLFVDGLRGVAAMMVVVYHLRLAVSEVSAKWVWPGLETLLGYGFLGVDIFFVISGFVISYSVRNYLHTPGFLFRFGLRRSIRLDPPYWIAIALELIAIKLGLYLFPALGTTFPSPAKIAAHFVYLQNLLGYGNLVDIFWTLCFEVQFYIVLVGMLVLAKTTSDLLGSRFRRVFVFASAAIAFSWSILIFFGPLNAPDGLFIARWFQFFLGVLAMNCVTAGRVSPAFVLCWLSVLAGVLFGANHAPIGLTTMLISGLLVVAGLRGKMAIWLSGAGFQFLGRISYSLYLLHPVVGWRFIKLLSVLHGSAFTAAQAWAAFFSGIGVSVFSAWMMYRLVEGPALKVCHRIAMDRPLNLRSRLVAAFGRAAGGPQ